MKNYDMVKADRDGKALALASIATGYLKDVLASVPDDDWHKEFYAGRLEWCQKLHEEIEEITKELHNWHTKPIDDDYRGS